MRLINTSTLIQKEFLGADDLPEYATLSHCWGSPGDEVSFREFQDKQYRQDSYGWAKIAQCCRLAKTDGLEWAWVDTCCIDKTSSAELTEAINSMFKWYKEGKVCYTFLPDVSAEPLESYTLAGLSSFRNSRWFLRGWTLQELLAPPSVVFFDKTFREIGTRDSLAQAITETTGIDISYLKHWHDFRSASIATRMS